MVSFLSQLCHPCELNIILIFLTYLITCIKQSIDHIPTNQKKGKLTIKYIFEHNKNWEKYKKIKKDIRDVEIKEAEKMLNCSNPSKGYLTYVCEDCGAIKHRPFTCKSRICTHCGKKFVDKWSNKIASEMFDVTHRHMIFTVPDELWPYIKRNRKLLNVLVRGVNKSLNRLVNENKKYRDRKVVLGVICVIHQQGKDLKYNSHIHAIVTEGGLDKDNIWVKYNYFPYDKLREIWQEEVLRGLAKEMKITDEIEDMINLMYLRYPNGFVLNGKRKIEEKDKDDVTRYIARYIHHPAIGERRICHYDGKTVSFWYVNEDEQKIKEEGKIVLVTTPVFDFIEGILMQVPDPQFKMIRYYGIYAQSKKKKIQEIMTVLGKFKAENKKAETEEMVCEICGGTMKFIGITYPDDESNYEPSDSWEPPLKVDALTDAKKEVDVIEDAIRKLENESDINLASFENLVKEVEIHGVTTKTLEGIIDELKDKGVIIEARFNGYKIADCATDDAFAY